MVEIVRCILVMMTRTLYVDEAYWMSKLTSSYLNMTGLEMSLYILEVHNHCPESRFLCSGTQGWIPSMFRVDSEQWQQAVFTNHFLLSFFLIIDVLNSMYIMIICITCQWMVQASMVIRDSEKHHVISDISIILIWTRIHMGPTNFQHV